MTAPPDLPVPDWPELLRTAARRFGLAPDAVWRLSLAEWRALAAAPPLPEPLDRAGFAALAAAHPDAPPARRRPAGPDTLETR